MADNKSTYSSLMHELVDTINEKANSSDSKNLEELVATAKTIVKPEGTLEITENKQYDVSGYALANVNVASSGATGGIKAILDISKSMYRWFYNNTALVEVESLLNYNDTENVESMEECWSGCTNLETIPNLNYNNVKTLKNAFLNCTKFTKVSLDLPNTTNGYRIFKGCNKIEELNFNAPEIEDLTEAFEYLYILKKINVNIPSATILKFAFSNVGKNLSTPIEELSLTNIPNVYNIESCFEYTNIKKIKVDASKVTLGSYAFQYSKVEEIDLINTPLMTNASSMFYSCEKTHTISNVNIVKITSNSNVTNMFMRCLKLANLTIYNIKVNLTIGYGSTYGHLLTLESLLNTCQECINVSASRTLTIGTANVTKLSSVYVKLTGEPEVDSTLPKLPMVQCESTDEGAMLVADYMALKQWSLA